VGAECLFSWITMIMTDREKGIWIFSKKKR